MLDPIFDFFIHIVARIRAFIMGIVNGVHNMIRFVVTSVSFRSPDPDKPLPLGTKIRRAFGALVLLIIFGWYGDYFFNAIYIRDFDYDYPSKVIVASATPPESASTPQAGATPSVIPAGQKSCGRAQTVEMTKYLINFLVEDNRWIPSMPQHKAGLIAGVVDWDDTPFFDRKSMFQKGVLTAVRRMSIELGDTLGRVRGTSGADPDLLQVRGFVQYDMETWWFNPFSTRPFGPITPSDVIYRKAIPLLERYNTRLEKCEALFDTRADNLYQVLDRITKDLGSTVDGLSQRSRVRQYNSHTKKFEPGEGNELGFFDIKADGMFWEALGEVYAWHGLLQAMHKDFTPTADTFRLHGIWDDVEAHMAEAIILDPLVVSNGAEDGIIMPAHLTALAQHIQRARADMVEMRDIIHR